MEKATWNHMVDHAPPNGQAITATVWHQERCKCTVVSAEGALQVEVEAECFSFVRQNFSCKVKGLQQCATMRIKD